MKNGVSGKDFFFDEYIFPMVYLPYLCFLVFYRIAFKWSFMSGLYLPLFSLRMQVRIAEGVL